MNYFQILSGCSSPELASILGIAKKLLDLIQIFGPILLIISLGFTFVKLMQHPDEKKLVARLKNSALALVLVFFIPLSETVRKAFFRKNTCFFPFFFDSIYNSVLKFKKN